MDSNPILEKVVYHRKSTTSHYPLEWIRGSYDDEKDGNIYSFDIQEDSEGLDGLYFYQTLPKKTLCIFAYYEKDEICRKNLEFFVRHAILHHHGHNTTNTTTTMDYIIVVNDDKGTFSKSNIEVLPNNVRWMTRPNKGYDFGAYTFVLNHDEVDISPYTHFIFINSSVRGPFLRKSSDTLWADIFLDMIRGDVHLVGTTINMFGPPETLFTENHVQSMMFAMDAECLQLLFPTIFSHNHPTDNFGDTVVQKEIAMSQLVLKKGWNISCTAKKYQGVDYRLVRKNINPSTNDAWGDSIGPRRYFGTDHDPYELVFIKTNRELQVPDFIH